MPEADNRISSRRTGYQHQLSEPETKGVHGSDISGYFKQIQDSESREPFEGGKWRVYEIAEQVGFSEYKYFCSVFRKYTGMSPRSL